MLLRFSVQNFLSFNEEVSLDLIPASKLGTNNILSDDVGRKISALPLSLLYGANGAGKSNVFKAMKFASNLIITGTKGDQSLGNKIFKLDKACLEKPTIFRFTFKNDGVIYDYGFAILGNKIVEEWLYGKFFRKELQLFARTVNKKGISKFEFGAKLRTRKKKEADRLGFVAAGTRDNQLFLSEAYDRNVKGIHGVMNWFSKKLIFISPNAVYSNLPIKTTRDNEFGEYLSNLMRYADTGIDGISALEKDFDIDKQFPELSSKDKQEMIDRIAFISNNKNQVLRIQYMNNIFTISFDRKTEKLKIHLIKTIHKSETLGAVEFAPSDESDGTIRLMNIAPSLLDLTLSDKVYIIDEIDRSLHPILTKGLIEQFVDKVKHGLIKGQLILTTHQTCILNLKNLRSDEINFIEKDKSGASHISSLVDFHVRGDLRLEKGYLNGRFGAIPFLGDGTNVLRTQ